MSTFDTVDHWTGTNPLRCHRRTQQISLIKAAAEIGVSVNTLTKWEAGATMPRPENFARMAALIGRPIHEEWQRWHQSKPAGRSN